MGNFYKGENIKKCEKNDLGCSKKYRNKGSLTDYLVCGTRRGTHSSLIRMESTADADCASILHTINRIFVSSDEHVRDVVVFKLTDNLHLLELTEIANCDEGNYRRRDSTFNTLTLVAATITLVAGVAEK